MIYKYLGNHKEAKLNLDKACNLYWKTYEKNDFKFCIGNYIFAKINLTVFKNI